MLTDLVAAVLGLLPVAREREWWRPDEVGQLPSAT